MRLLVCASLLAMLPACADPFAVAQEADTIEAYEKYLSENPDGRFASAAESRLEALMLERAREQGTVEAYDAYMKRFPAGALRAQAVSDRESTLFAFAKKENTAETWQKFLDEYPKTEKSREKFAKEMLEVHEYLPNLEIGTLTVKQVNLAEDPEGPLNGWSFTTEVKNAGSKTITNLGITVQYLSPEDRVLGERMWPLVAPYWKIPVEESAKTPIKPGQSRPWVWTTGDLPAGWDRRARIFVSNIEVES